MHYLYLDTECFYSRDVCLGKMTLRNYLAASHLLGLSYGIDDTPTEWLIGPKLDDGFLEFLEWAANQDDWTFVCHNAAFDIRVLRFMLGISQPKHVHCTLEMAYGVLPNQPKGYGLAALCEYLGLGDKLKIDLNPGQFTAEELATYCIRDTDLCRKLHQWLMERMPAHEVEIMELAQAVRELHLEIDMDAVAKAIVAFNAAASEEATVAAAGLGIDMDYEFEIEGKAGTVFGRNDDHTLRSIKPARLKYLLLENLGFEAQSTSVKKINPARLALNQDASKVIHATSRANKALSHRRKMAVFAGVPIVDVELAYHAAHTGRYSSKMAANTTGQSAKGVNLHNIPKRNKKVAEPVRRIFKAPAGYCWVSGDLANAEYRMEGWLCESPYVENLYTRDLLADPYSTFGTAATGRPVDKSMPVRQVWKNSVLGLGFGMGIQRWIHELLLMLADYDQNKVTIGDLHALCEENRWTPTTDGRAQAAQTKLGAPWEVATVAFHSRRIFHEIHPEFLRTARWIIDTLMAVASALDPEAAIERAYTLPAAPRRERLGLIYDPTLGPGRTVRVNCGGWTPTVTWRDIGIHDTKFGPTFACVAAGDKGYRPLNQSVVIENVTQSAARNALVKGKLRLKQMEHPYLLSVHDECKILAAKQCADVLKAANDLMEVYGPGNTLGWGWAVVMNPEEVTVSQSLWETPIKSEFWDALARGDASPLQVLV